MTISPEDIAWAAKAYHAGRPLDFLASVLGETPKKTFALIKAHRDIPKGCPVAASRSFIEANAAFERAITKAKPAAKPKIYKLDQFRLYDEEGEFFDRPQLPSDKAARDAEIASYGRRKRCLSRFFAKHWDSIWFHRGRGMCGRTLRQIYGDAVLVWSVGGGIDPEIQ